MLSWVEWKARRWIWRGLPRVQAAADTAYCETFLRWRPIEEARKDSTVILAALHDDLSERVQRPDLKRWNGVQIPLRHRGLAEDGYDEGWEVAAPLGYGGIPDAWIAGWMKLFDGPEGSDSQAVEKQ